MLFRSSVPCLSVSFSGIVDGTCGYCDCHNRTFATVPQTTGCDWLCDYGAKPLICRASPLTYGVHAEVVHESGDWILRVEYSGHVFEKNYEQTPPVMEELVDEPIAWISSTSACNSQNALCLVTGLAEPCECPQSCTVGTCEHCACNELPETVAITIAGLTGSCFSKPCSVLNEIWIATCPPVYLSYACGWWADVPFPNTNWGYVISIHAFIALEAGTYYLYVVLNGGGDPAVIQVTFRLSLGGDLPNCMNFDDDIPFLSSNGSWCCDETNITCHLTSL